MAGEKGGGLNSRAKGVRGELQVAHLFQALGYRAERGVQHDGRTGHADVEGVPYIWIEVKRDEDLVVEKAVEQAERDSAARYERTREDLIPVVIHKKNRQPWKATMRVKDFLDLCGVERYSETIPTKGLVTMLMDDWGPLYVAYEQERRRG